MTTVSNNIPVFIMYTSKSKIHNNVLLLSPILSPNIYSTNKIYKQQHIWIIKYKNLVDEIYLIVKG